MNKLTIVLDFDGVIHSYKSEWQDVDIIPDEPVEGIRETIQELRKQYEVIVVSTRCMVSSGMIAIKDYLAKHDIEVDGVTAVKPPAIVYVDDRAICFDGDSKTLISKIQNFVPWNK